MKQRTKAKGISLIVLVITIIIIIILAGAVILSLTNSNVINKAKSGIMQNDVSTIKEQINNKMMDNDFNGTDIKIGTKVWEDYYTMSVSQLQEIGITTKNDCLYNYKTGGLSLKQNNVYVTPEELYARDSATNYIEGYVTYSYPETIDPIYDEETGDLISSTPFPVLEAQKMISGGIKVMLYDSFDTTNYANGTQAEPKYTVETTNEGYFILQNITPGQYAVVIDNQINTLPFISLTSANLANVKYINVVSNTKTTLFKKETPLKLHMGNINRTGTMFKIEFEDYMDYLGNYGRTTDYKKFDFNMDSKITALDISIVSANYNLLTVGYPLLNV